MNNVDHIIQYLSGELNQEESVSFKEMLEKDPDLNNQYEEVSAAYDLIRDQLQKRDLENFRQTLYEVMENKPLKRSPPHPNLRSWRYLPLLLAGALAMLLAILLSNPGERNAFSKFYHPEEDPVLLALNQGTRGTTEAGILYFQRGQYAKTMELMSELLDQEPDNQLAQLYYLLSSIETGMHDQALEKLAPLDLNLDHRLGQALCWYMALAYLNSGRFSEADSNLQLLIQQRGPYQSDAIRLQKNLLK